MNFPRRNLSVLLSLGLFLFCLFAWSSLAGADDAVLHRTENVFLITYDGLRWQEVFGGADETLLSKEAGGVRDVEALKQRFWADTPEQRREKLLPFFWSTLANQGQVFGDPSRGAAARVTNGRNFSYPGYSEILCGFPDDRIDANAKRFNPNVTVLEWLHRRPGFDGRVAAFTSWDLFPWIINDKRSGVYVNSGWMPFEHATDPMRLAALNDLVRDETRIWDNVRSEALTFHGMVEYIKVKKPRVLYASFGETDDWAHEGRYDHYLATAWQTDQYIERLWKLIQSMPEYAGKTSLVLTTDHGRGDTRVEWKSHGKDIPGSHLMWMTVLGPDTPALGVRENVEVTQSQVAATIAALLGEDYAGAVENAGKPLPGVLKP
jgi:hypothetical protein